MTKTNEKIIYCRFCGNLARVEFFAKKDPDHFYIYCKTCEFGIEICPSYPYGRGPKDKVTIPPPRYDEVFFEGLKWLDSLAEDE